MDDKWTETLRCPNCGKKGKASLTQGELSQAPTVDSVSQGFKVVGKEFGPSFHCQDCEVEVVP
jgi:predicted RNA-binding Zn-ribbon protein involved in translation (DUF1610 family)